jgi:DNA-binding MarR family transcriptional regulator
MVMGEINRYSVFGLLTTYKEGYGIFSVTGDSYVSNTLTNLEKMGIVKLVSGIPTRRLVVSLTDKGFDYIRENLLSWLKTAYLYQIRPILLINDLVRVLEDLANSDRCSYVIDPHTKITAGTYKIAKFNGQELHLLSTSDIIPVGVRLYECRRHLSLVQEELGNTEHELRKRSGKISSSTLTSKFLKLGLDNFQVVDLLQQLRQSKATVGRWIMIEMRSLSS